MKDSCAQIRQILDLLANKPQDFGVLTGEDILFYTNLANGGDGGILATAHLYTERFLEVFRHVANNDHRAALDQWHRLEAFIPLLFEEPNPAPVKYCLSRLNRIRSSEIRLPLTPVSERLKEKLDDLLLS